ncbi:MAG: hypothetical protein INH37_07840, partial [Myxococcaceae bacterium]|nr:hypothetical protein [Myxococcaceae bacterium]
MRHAAGARVLVVGSFALLVQACSAPPPPRVCVPGSTQPCSTLACLGMQRCNTAGSAWEACTCLPSGVGGVGGGVAGSGLTGGGFAGGGFAGGGFAGGGSAGGGSAACSPANCGGCCDGAQCVLPPANASASRCGVNGVACVNCAASGASCDLSTFTCTFNTGGGSAGGSGGGSATCDGCRLANGVCRPRNSSLQSNGICGSSGALCASCIGTATPICDNGACVAGVKRVGDACLSDVECASLGTGAVCKRASLAGNVTYAGGMCTIQNCSATAVCPIGSSCLNFPRIFGDEVAACYVTACSQTAPCRSGYTCFSVGNNQSGCLPSDFGNRSLQFDTTSVVGQACTLDAQCRAPTPGAPGAGGFCNPELAQRPNGTSVPTGNPGGFCSRDCRL